MGHKLEVPCLLTSSSGPILFVAECHGICSKMFSVPFLLGSFNVTTDLGSLGLQLMFRINCADFILLCQILGNTFLQLLCIQNAETTHLTRITI